MKKLIIAIILISTIFLTGCLDTDKVDTKGMFKDYRNINISNESNKTVTPPNNNVTVDLSVYDINLSNKLVIGSFNLQIYGDSKASNEPVMKGIHDIIDDYDIIALQEIRDKDGSSLSKLIEGMSDKTYVVSERLGRSFSKEQYIFLYDKDITSFRPTVYPDEKDYFERPPYMSKFVVEDLQFVIIQVHTKPEDAFEEIRHLPEVINYAKEFYGENKVFLVGDLNADCNYYIAGSHMNTYLWLIDDDKDTTTTRTDCAYDRIISNTDYGNKILCDVDNYEDDDISKELGSAISDHYPVMCELNI